jgi:hypothetical protein
MFFQQNDQKKPLENQKQNATLFRNDDDTLTRTSDFGPFPEGAEAQPLDFGPDVALDLLFHLDTGYPIFVPAKKKLHAVGTNKFFWVLHRVLRYYGVNTVPRPGEQFASIYITSCLIAFSNLSAITA